MVLEHFADTFIKVKRKYRNILIVIYCSWKNKIYFKNKRMKHISLFKSDYFKRIEIFFVIRQNH